MAFIHFQNNEQKLISVDEDQKHHFLKVRRLKVGQKVKLVDQEGQWYWGQVFNRDPLQINIEEKWYQAPPPYPLVLCQALCQQSQMELIVQKASELNFSKVIFFASEFSSQKNIKTSKWQRLQKIEQSANTQCGRAKELEIIFEDWESLINKKLFSTSYLADWNENLSFTKKEAATFSLKNNHYLWIGPEGGWSLKEKSFFDEKKVAKIILSPLILKAETAAIAGMAWMVDCLLSSKK